MEGGRKGNGMYRISSGTTAQEIDISVGRS